MSRYTPPLGTDPYVCAGRHVYGGRTLFTFGADGEKEHEWRATKRPPWRQKERNRRRDRMARRSRREQR